MSDPYQVPVPQPVAPVPSGPVDTSSWFCRDPVKGSHFTYSIGGIDDEGIFEGSRRYNDFYALREHLVRNWPGVYIPPIPPKKMTGNKDERFVEDRVIFLDRFMKQISTHQHLTGSDTFKAFTRPSGEIEKMLAMHPKPTPESIVDKFKTALFVDEFPDEMLVKNSRESINDFSAFCKRIAPVLSKIKSESSKWVPIKTHHNHSFKSLIDLLGRYEEETLTTYCDSNANKLVVGDINDTELKEKAESMHTELRNPYEEFYHWVRGECNDVEALYEAIRGRDRLVE